MEFARKHLLDKFFLEDVNRVSLRNILAREMISNTLMHREFTSSYMAKFVIEKDRMYVENANRASGNGFITPENLEPNPQNPIIASFFRTIGFADNLGSGRTKCAPWRTLRAERGCRRQHFPFARGASIAERFLCHRTKFPMTQENCFNTANIIPVKTRSLGKAMCSELRFLWMIPIPMTII